MEVGTRLAQALRPGDGLARYGGEEFAEVLPTAGAQELVDIAERCRLAVGTEPVVLPDGAQVTVTASIGAAARPEHGTSPLDVLQAADRALDTAKAAGRDRALLAHGAHETDLERLRTAGTT